MPSACTWTWTSELRGGLDVDEHSNAGQGPRGERQRHQQVGVEGVRLDLEVELEGEVDRQLDAVGDLRAVEPLGGRRADGAVRAHLGDLARIGPKSIGWPAIVLTAPRMRSPLTASAKKSCPHRW